LLDVRAWRSDPEIRGLKRIRQRNHTVEPDMLKVSK
jgi:hypothetical protein